MTSTFAPLLAALNVSVPWLSPYLVVGRQVAARLEVSVAAALNDTASDLGIDIRFVKQSAIATDEPYEAFIARTRLIPTRDNIHDFFNGLVWLTFPETKRRLNTLQAQQIARVGVSGPRGALRDALTLFDENAAVLQAPADLVDALRHRDWKTLFVTQRSCWQSTRLVLFGHALLEKLLHPRKAITAHVWIVEDVADAALATTLSPDRLSTRGFSPLPVLGVPGWWPENEAVGFYDDDTVFRPTHERVFRQTN